MSRTGPLMRTGTLGAAGLAIHQRIAQDRALSLTLHPPPLQFLRMRGSVGAQSPASLYFLISFSLHSYIHMILCLCAGVTEWLGRRFHVGVSRWGLLQWHLLRRDPWAALTRRWQAVPLIGADKAGNPGDQGCWLWCSGIGIVILWKKAKQLQQKGCDVIKHNSKWCSSTFLQISGGVKCLKMVFFTDYRICRWLITIYFQLAGHNSPM